MSFDYKVKYLKNQPISELNAIRAAYAALNIAIRVRYRGPRRPCRAGRQECLAADARAFSVYPRNGRKVTQWVSMGRVADALALVVEGNV